MEQGQQHSVRQNDYENFSSTAPQASTPRHRFSKWFHPNIESKLLVGLLVTSAVVALLAFFVTGISALVANSPIKGNQYQAVFLSNGQVYFGKITDIDGGYMVLEDIYYLQVDQQIQPERGASSSQQPQVQLIQLGDELHGPESEMFISTDQIVFWENLKGEGQVVQAINKFRAGNSSNQPAANSLNGDSREDEASNSNNSSNREEPANTP